MIERLSILSHPQRLAAFRLLVRRFPDEVPAGQLAQALDLKPNTASVYLSALKGAGLITQRRAGTSLLYRANLESVGDLVQFLLSDCCRDRLDVTVPHQSQQDLPDDSTTKRVLFICTGNSARSLCAESILRHTASDMFSAQSAGTLPSAQAHAMILDVLSAEGHDVTRLFPKDLAPLTAQQAEPFDVVITLCDRAANQHIATWQGQPLTTHWNIAKPTSATHAAFSQMYDALQAKIRSFSAIDFDGTTRRYQQDQLDQIGQHSSGVPL